MTIKDIAEQELPVINSYYIIVSKDRKYIVSGNGFNVKLVKFNRSWRPRMFKSTGQAMSLFNKPYNWGYYCDADLKVPSINYYDSPSKAEQTAYYKNLLDNYFDIIRVGVVELR